MQPMFDVLSYGTIGLDYILHVPYWPTPGRGVHAAAEEEHLGGKATNTAVMLGGWGLRVAVSGHTIGDDAVGERLFERLAEHPNVSTRFIGRQAGLRSMYCRILVNPEGERTIIGVSVDENPQTPPTPEMVGSARLLTLDLYGGEERVVAARLARELGRPVVVGDLRDADHPVLPYTTVAIASAAEIAEAYPAESVAWFVERVHSHGVEAVIVTDGPRDVRVSGAGGRERAEIVPPQVDVVDTTGAGDSFRAGVVYGVAQGEPLVEAAALGAAAGSLAVQQQGAASTVPSIDRVKALAAGLTRRVLV